jgi:hypothetical protein
VKGRVEEESVESAANAHDMRKFHDLKADSANGISQSACEMLLSVVQTFDCLTSSGRPSVGGAGGRFETTAKRVHIRAG